MGLKEEILQKLTEKGTHYDELEKAFPHTDLAQFLMDMEHRKLVENRRGVWFITRKGEKEIQKGKQKVYNVLVVPAICFFLLSAYLYMGYTDVHDENMQLLQEKADAEENLFKTNEDKKAAETEENAKLSELSAEQDETAQLDTSYENTKESVYTLQEEVDYFECLERCYPDTFVTVDNVYIKEKVDEITKGLKTLKQKQKAIYEFVRDHIIYDENRFRSGRIDLWEYPEDVLKRGSGQFEDKFLVLLTMFRTAGTPPEHVRFVAAEVDGNDNWIWVEAYDGSNWWILDPFEGYTFTSHPKDEFYREHKVVILWWFNDTGFVRG